MAFSPFPMPFADAIAALPPEETALILRHIGGIEQCELSAEGTNVHAYRLNGAWVLRCARSAAAPLVREARLLTEIGARLAPELRQHLPIPELSGPGWTLHRHLPGCPTGRRVLHALPAAHRARLLDDLGHLLAALHSLTLPAPVPAADTPHGPDQWEELRARAEARVFPLLSAHLTEDLRAHLDAVRDVHLATRATGLIHDDLHPAHILHDPASGRLTGLLDFGRSGRGDAAVDLAGLLYNWGSALLGGLAYPGLEGQLPRARALARTYELQWALEGLERQDSRWLLYALGAAKDF